MRDVNRNLRHLSENLGPLEPVAFFCECQSPTCYSAIWMSVAAYDATLTDRESWLLLAGHEPGVRLPNSRSEAVETTTLRRSGVAAPVARRAASAALKAGLT